MNHYAIFGGTFDPVHCGHIALVRYVLSYMQDATIVVSCAYQNPHKVQNVCEANAEHRLAMIKRAFTNMSRVIINESEVRSRNISYTVDMLMRFREVYAVTEKMYFIIGSDIVKDIHQWKDVEKFTDIVKFLIYPRVDEKLSYDCCISQCNVLHTYSFEYVWLDNAPRIAISSTDIRRRYKKNGFVENILPASVHKYIRQHSLYV